MVSTYLYRHRLTRTLAAGSLLLPIFLQAQTTPVRVPLTMATIAQTLRSAGVEANESQIRLPLEIRIAASARSTLLVTGAEVLGGAQLRVRLACGDPHDCLPFFATLQCTDESAARIAASSFSSSSLVAGLPIRTVDTSILRPGDHAMLLLEDRQMQITFPVFFIDSGKVGSTVRVSTLDRKKTFLATIVDPQTVRGTLP